MPLLNIFSQKQNSRLLSEADATLVERFEHFRGFLLANRNALNAIAELEQIYYGGTPTSKPQVLQCVKNIEASASDVIIKINALGKNRYSVLSERMHTIIANIESATVDFLPVSHPLVLPLAMLRPGDEMFAGSKACNLGVLGSALSIPVPDGFAITADAFTRFIEVNGLRPILDQELAEVNLSDIVKAEAACARIREVMLQAPVPGDLVEKILSAYEALEGRTTPGVRIAVRSSAIGEDTAASFAGQYHTELNVTRAGLLDAYRKVLASKYSLRAVTYRLRFGLDDEDTPMCVACIAMVDSASSGVAYTVDPDEPASGLMRVAAVAGLAELLVSGEATPDTFLLDRTSLDMRSWQRGNGRHQLISLSGGGTTLRELPENPSQAPVLTSEALRRIGELASRIEQHFRGPQDIEWAQDSAGKLYILQARPLGISAAAPENSTPVDLSGCPVLLENGKTASRGFASGPAHLLRPGMEVPEGVILVTTNSSPDLAVLVGRVRGIVAETGSIASHLASVAREFSVPMLVDCPGATSSLPEGTMVTLAADLGMVVAGEPPNLPAKTQGKRTLFFESPVSRRLRAVLDHISPLNLTDPESSDFLPESCRTLHDIIRFAHEKVMRIMFGMAESATDNTPTIKLDFNIPMSIYFIDLGEGLRSGLTTTDKLAPGDIRSIPMKAFWKGLSHPGINWSGAVGLSLRNFSSVMAGGAMAGNTLPGGDSFVLVANDYMNISAKFGYHYANIDAYCSEDADQNHVALQFSGGIGTFAGKMLRLTFLSEVLTRLGYKTTVTGDQLEARLAGAAREQMEDILDHTGRLLAASRLLDVGIPNQEAVTHLFNAFFNEDYDFLKVADKTALPGFYVPLGQWQAESTSAGAVITQNGKAWGDALSTGVADLMGHMIGPKYQTFLDGIEAYFYFPLVIAKSSEMGDGMFSVDVKSVSGRIDAAAGLAFGLRNAGNYFVWRINALENNAVLFEFINNRRLQRAETTLPLRKDRWYTLQVQVDGTSILAFVDGRELVRFEAATAVEGHLGLWTKADSTSMFKNLSAHITDREPQRFEPDFF